MNLRIFTFYALAFILGIFISIATAIVMITIPTFFMDTNNESDYKLIKTKSINEIETRVKKLYFWDKRENCVFQFKDEDGKEIDLDLAKDIVYFKKCEDNTICTETLSKDKYRIFYGNGTVINEQKLISFTNMCTKIHTKE